MKGKIIKLSWFSKVMLLIITLSLIVLVIHQLNFFSTANAVSDDVSDENNFIVRISPSPKEYESGLYVIDQSKEIVYFIPNNEGYKRATKYELSKIEER